MTKGAADEIDRHVARKLKKARGDIGISMEQAAAITGVSWQQIQKYENGLSRLSASRLAKLSKLYRKPLVWFFPAAYQDSETRIVQYQENKINSLKEKLKSIEKTAKEALK